MGNVTPIQGEELEPVGKTKRGKDPEYREDRHHGKNVQKSEGFSTGNIVGGGPC